MDEHRIPLGPPRFDFTDLEDEDFELLCFLVVLLDFPHAERLRPPDGGTPHAPWPTSVMAIEEIG